MSRQTTFPPKAFQSATIRAVLRSFDDEGGPRRFLVADEAGLGKTVVARGVIQTMMERTRRRPLVVFYVCSNQAIASQNTQQLVAFLNENARADAVTKADRPGLLPLFPAAAHPLLHLYPITPATLSSSAKRGLGRGKVQERALAYVLIEQKAGRPIPWLRELLSWNTSSFSQHVQLYQVYLRQQMAARNGRLTLVYRQFHTALNEAFNLQPRASALPSLCTMADKSTLLTAVCRNALAAAALSGLRPDLVVFDEFQRFRGLMREASAGDDDSPLARLNTRILQIVTGSAADTKLLLLSATPYEALRMQGNVNAGPEQNDFFAVLDFLHHHLPDGKRRSAQVRSHFAEIGDQMRQGKPMSSSARASRECLTDLLSDIMCRTERDRYRQQKVHENRAEIVESQLMGADMKAFRAFANSLREDDRYWAVPLWTSVPLPGQTLGAKYVCWKNAKPLVKSAAVLSATGIVEWRRPPAWPNFKARALLKTLPVAPLSMPWVRPSHLWWPLEGGWAGQPARDEVDGKVLVFSRFAAVPGAVAAVTSYQLECELRTGKTKLRAGTYGTWSKHKYTKPHSRAEVFQLFFIPTLLVGIDPLAQGAPGSRQAARAVVSRRLKIVLRANQVVINNVDRRKPLPLHLLLIALSRQCGYWTEERAAWCAALAGSADGLTEKSVDEALRAWERKAPKILPFLSSQECNALVALAMDSPAIVIARALQRHWPDALSNRSAPKTPSPRQIVQSLAADSLRDYLDRPWFAAALGETEKHDYATVLRRAVIDGNFESVLDEHFWLLSMTSSESWPKRISDLAASLSLNGGRTVIHTQGAKGKNGRIRCHVALPLHQARSPDAKTTAKNKHKDAAGDAQKPPRPDQVRHAFNTPFWPNVLVTTSIGQEGLDFHPWCRSIAHWDPARGPVELEQREGRVDRYAGLSIRRALAVNPECAPAADAGSVWSSIGERAGKLTDPNEMAPWWQVDGARTVQFYLTTPGSRESEVLRKLERGRALYRMLIGVSDPEQLLAEIETENRVTVAEAIDATLRLGAWELEQANTLRARRA